MEALVYKGLVRSIGISNFTIEQIERLLKNCTIKPANHQIEVHAYLSQKPLRNLCQQHGIVVSSYGSLGRPGMNEPDDPVLLDDPTIKQLAAKYDKSAAQIALRYLVFPSIESENYQNNLIMDLFL